MTKPYSLPAPLAEVLSDFQDMQGQDKLKLLLEFADELPPLPANLEEAAMEPVPECQSPLFLHVDAADREIRDLPFLGLGKGVKTLCFREHAREKSARHAVALEIEEADRHADLAQPRRDRLAAGGLAVEIR